MITRIRLPAVVLASALASGGCGATLASATASYKKGDYPTAKNDFAAIEKETLAKGGCERAQYELYRGLNHLGLADKAVAKQWLEWAKDHNDTMFKEKLNECFGKDDLSRLALGLESIGSR